MEFAPRDTIDNQYKVLEKHQGGMSTVYIVLDDFSHRRFALKTVREDLLENRSALERFTSEARMWMNLGRHPNVVEAIIYREIEGQAFLFLECIDGGDLQRLLDQEKRLFIPQFYQFALQVCDAMDYIHNVPLEGGSRGIIHRDLKPANFMLNRQCQVKIADFGLAKVQGAPTGDVDPGKGLGTYLYMPPEQFLDAASADKTSDIYAFGVAMYIALTGKPPLEAESGSALVHKILNQRPLPPVTVNPEIPAALNEVVMQCLAKARQERFLTFSALGATLRALGQEIAQRFEGREGVLRCSGCGYLTLRKYIVCPMCASNLTEITFGREPVTPAPPAEAAPAAPAEALAADDVVKTLYDRAVANYTEGRLPQALSLLRQVLSLAPDHAEATGLLDRVALDLARSKSPQNGRAYNWPMFRGSTNRGGCTPEVVPPPLALAWRSRVGDWTMSSPAVCDGIAYIGSHVDRAGLSGRLSALSAHDGRVQWSADTANEITGAPCVVNRKLACCAYQNRMVALSLENGRKVWQFATNDLVCSSALCVQDLLYFGSSDGNAYAVKAETGELAWTFATEMEIISSAAAWESFVYIGSADNRLYCLDAARGTPVWEFMTGAEISGAPATARGRVFVGSADHRLYCLDGRTGRRVWEFQTGGEVHSSPAVTQTTVFIGSRDKRVYGVDIETGQCKWYFPTGDWVESSPAVSGRTVYVGSLDKKLYGLEIETGVCLWEYLTEGEVKSSPAVSGGKVFVGSNDGYLYCFRAR